MSHSSPPLRTNEAPSPLPGGPAERRGPVLHPSHGRPRLPRDRGRIHPAASGPTRRHAAGSRQSRSSGIGTPGPLAQRRRRNGGISRVHPARKAPGVARARPAVRRDRGRRRGTLATVAADCRVPGRTCCSRRPMSHASADPLESTRPPIRKPLRACGRRKRRRQAGLADMNRFWLNGSQGIVATHAPNAVGHLYEPLAADEYSPQQLSWQDSMP